MSTTAIQKPVINPYEAALENFDLAADALELDENVRAMIKYPERILSVSVPVRMDGGNIVRFEGYRVQHKPRPLQGRHPLPSQRHPG
jgi:glutamate dehydrogenase/leucine dehydrogenase